MHKFTRLEVLLALTAFVLAVAAYLAHPNTLDFFAVIATSMALVLVIARVLLLP